MDLPISYQLGSFGPDFTLILPDEIMWLIFAFLNFKLRIRVVEKVCKRWMDLNQNMPERLFGRRKNITIQFWQNINTSYLDEHFGWLQESQSINEWKTNFPALERPFGFDQGVEFGCEFNNSTFDHVERILQTVPAGRIEVYGWQIRQEMIDILAHKTGKMATVLTLKGNKASGRMGLEALTIANSFPNLQHLSMVYIAPENFQWPRPRPLLKTLTIESMTVTVADVRNLFNLCPNLKKLKLVRNIFERAKDETLIDIHQTLWEIIAVKTRFIFFYCGLEFRARLPPAITVQNIATEEGDGRLFRFPNWLMFVDVRG